MKKWLIGILTPVLMAAGLCGCSSLPDEELSPSDLTVAELEQRMSGATDPEGRYAKAGSFIMRQEVVTKRWLEPDKVQMVETKFMRPDFFKLTTYDDNQPSLAIISNGENCWVADYGAKKVRVLDAKSLRQAKVMSEITKPGSRLSDIFKHITIQRCRMDGRDYYKLECWNNPDTVLNIYVDAANYQTSRVHFSSRDGLKYDSSLRGYGLYEGVRIPEETSFKTDGSEKISRVIYYKLDPVIDSAEFRPPVF